MRSLLFELGRTMTVLGFTTSSSWFHGRVMWMICWCSSPITVLGVNKERAWRISVKAAVSVFSAKSSVMKQPGSLGEGKVFRFSSCSKISVAGKQLSKVRQE